MPLSPCVIVPTEDASIQKTGEKLKVIEFQSRGIAADFKRHSPASHFLNKLHANLSFSNTSHSIQQKGFSLMSCVICVRKEMLPQFGDDSCVACEPIARIWHEGNDPIGHRPITIIDVHLPEIPAISLVHWNIYMITILLTVVAV